MPMPPDDPRLTVRLKLKQLVAALPDHAVADGMSAVHGARRGSDDRTLDDVGRFAGAAQVAA